MYNYQQQSKTARQAQYEERSKRIQARQEDGAASGTERLTANERVKITREGRKKEKEGNSPLLDQWLLSEIRKNESSVRKNEAVASYFSHKLNLARGATQPTTQP